MSTVTVLHALAVVLIIVSAYLGSVSAFIGLIGLMVGRAGGRQIESLRHLRTALLCYLAADVVWTWAFESSADIFRNALWLIVTFGIMVASTLSFAQILDRTSISSWWPQVRMPFRAMFAAALILGALVASAWETRLVLAVIASVQVALLGWELWLRRHDVGQ